MSRLWYFVAGDTGEWHISSIEAISGWSLAFARRLDVIDDASAAGDGAWSLRGIVSNQRYVTREEHSRLVMRQESTGRPQATHACLIPIKKSPEWWALTQDERREILADRSRHIAIGLEYLPAVARRLHHCRDLGSDEPFDFLTWFEYAPEHAPAFTELLTRLRASEEWRYVVREVEVRLESA
jgi:chlorite dismutase